MPFPVVDDKAPNPRDIRLLGPRTVVSEADLLPNTIGKLRPRTWHPRVVRHAVRRRRELHATQRTRFFPTCSIVPRAGVVISETDRAWCGWQILRTRSDRLQAVLAPILASPYQQLSDRLLPAVVVRCDWGRERHGFADILGLSTESRRS